MNETEYKVLRSKSIDDLRTQLKDHLLRGWQTIGHVEAFDGGFAQPIQINAEIEDTEEIPDDITLEMDNSQFSI